MQNVVLYEVDYWLECVVFSSDVEVQRTSKKVIRRI